MTADTTHEQASELAERLLAITQESDGVHGIFDVLRNPDGPAAFAALLSLSDQVERLTKERDALRDALELIATGTRNATAVSIARDALEDAWAMLSVEDAARDALPALTKERDALDEAVWPKQLTPELREVLGMMCFQLGPIAHVYQKAGQFVGADGAALNARAEDEQAFMLHKLVGIALRHGNKWREVAQVELNSVRALKEAK